MTNLRLIVGIVGVIILGIGMIYLALSDRNAYFQRLDEIAPAIPRDDVQPDSQFKPSINSFTED